MKIKNLLSIIFSFGLFSSLYSQTLCDSTNSPKVVSAGPSGCNSSQILSGLNVPLNSTLQWRKDGIDIPGQQSPVLTVSQSGTYDFKIATSFTSIIDVSFSDFDPSVDQTINSVKMVTKQIGYMAHNNLIEKTLDGGSTWNAVYSGHRFSKIIFTDANTGWCFGGNKIIKTIDGGANWTEKILSLGTGYIFTASFSDSLKGIALINDYRTAYTDDGGENWIINSAITSGNALSLFKDIEFLPNSNIIYFISSGNGEIFKSTDKGITWILFQTKPNNLYDIQFVNSNDGFIYGSQGVLFVTQDGGQTWVNKSINAGQPAIIEFVSNQVGYIFGLRYIHKTKDGGNTWENFREMPFVENIPFFYDPVMDFFSEDNGLFSIHSSTQNPARLLLKKVSGQDCSTNPLYVDVNLNQIPELSISATKPELCFGESSTISLTGCTGTINWSNNSGNVNSITIAPLATTTYTATCSQNGCVKSQNITIIVNPKPKITASGPLVCDQNITLAATDIPAGARLQWKKDGLNILGSDTSLLTINTPGTYDFKVNPTFNQVYSNGNNYLLGFKFLDNKTGFYSNHGNLTIEKTNDNGLHWTTIEMPGTSFDYFFLDSLNYWTTAYYPSPQVYKTIDGGKNWNTYNSSENIVKLTFKDKNIGLGISNLTSNILRTTDGGETWTQVLTSNIEFIVPKIVFLKNTNTALITSGTNKLYRSIDNGFTWTISVMPFTAESLYFLDANIGYIGTSTNEIYKTTDGGNTWQKELVPTVGHRGHTFSFINSQIGYVGGNASKTIYKTIDGGNTWNLFKDFSSFGYIENFRMDFSSEDNGWIATWGNIPSFIIKVSSLTCSSTPLIVSPPIDSVPIISISATKTELCLGESSTISLTGCTGTINWSNNAGNVNSIIVSPLVTTTYTATCSQNGCLKTAISIITVNKTPKVLASGPLVCDQNITLTANDIPAGASLQWRKDGLNILGADTSFLSINTPGTYDFKVNPSFNQIYSDPIQYLLGFKFLDNKTGFYSVNYGTTINKTVDNGVSWTSLNLPGPSYDSFFLDSLTYWVTAYYPTSEIYKTIDGGKNWNTYNCIENMIKISFKDKNIGLAISNDPYYKLYRTIDGGETWNLVLNPNTDLLLANIVFLKNTNTVLLTSGTNRIYKSLDNGLTWTLQVMPFRTESLYFIDSNIGFIGTSTNEVYKTIDGGITWQAIIVPTIAHRGHAFSFINSQIGYVGGNFSKTIYKTIDGGLNWTLFEDYSNLGWQENFRLHFSSEDNGWIGNWVTLPSFLTKVSTVACSTIPAIVSLPIDAVPIISLSSNKTELCLGESSTISLTGCTGTKTWSNNAGNVNSITVSPINTTTYTATCLQGSCSKSNNITITVYPIPKITASGPLVCDQNITLTATGIPLESSLQWRKNGVNLDSSNTGKTIQVNTPGSYDFLQSKSNFIPLENNYNDVKFQFLNKDIGYRYNNYKISKTIDGGNSWNLIYTSSFNIYDFIFIDENNGWATGDNYIIKTQDGGNTWTSNDPNINPLLLDKFSFKDKNSAVGLASYSKKIYTLLDDGINWVSISNLDSSLTNLFDIKYLPNSSNVYVIGNSITNTRGVFGKSIDKGISWTSTSLPYQIFSMHFVNQNIGYLGSTDLILKTTNGGISWQNIPMSGIGEIKKIDFINSFVGFAIGGDGIYKTIDSGNTWSIFRSFINDEKLVLPLYGLNLDFVSENIGYYSYYRVDLGSFFFKKINTKSCLTPPIIILPDPNSITNFNLASTKTQLCPGESAVLTQSGCTGIKSWSTGAGNVNSISVSPSVTTIYSVTCKKGICVKTINITIERLKIPKITSANVGTCGTILTANDYPLGTFIKWRKNNIIIPGAINFSYKVLSTGTYDFLLSKPDTSNIKICSPVTPLTINNFVLGDIVAPNITCSNSGTVTKSVNTGFCTYTVKTNEFKATASDNSAFTLTYMLTGVTEGTGTNIAGIKLNRGITTITWTAIDVCGNKKSCSFKVKVVEELNLSDYMIFATKKISFADSNFIYGNIGLSSTTESVYFKQGNVLDPYFVKAKNISVQLPSSVNNKFFTVPTDGPTTSFLPYNGSTSGLSNKIVTETNTTLNGNWNNILIKSGVTVMLLGNNFGRITIEPGAYVTFNSSLINAISIEMQTGSNLIFTKATSLKVKEKVIVNETCTINADGPKVNFYVGDNIIKNALFDVVMFNTFVTSNIIIPKGKLRTRSNINSTGNMIGWYIVEELESLAKYISWFPYSCYFIPPANSRISAPDSVKTEEAKSFSVNVKPNPSSDQFSISIESNDSENATIRVHSITGAFVEEFKNVPINSEIIIGSKYNNGTYLAEIIQGKLKKVVKLIKEK
jgi:photosystem II stability/assembly factor-like uncharacterized protein